jgi:hypothetical protein
MRGDKFKQELDRITRDATENALAEIGRSLDEWLATLPKPEQPPGEVDALAHSSMSKDFRRVETLGQPPEASEQGEVTQEDRDAAANFVKAWDAKYGEGINDFGPSEVDSVWLRSGDHDGELIIQAMKRHRLTAIRTLEAEVEDLRQLDVILREMLGEQQAYAAAAEAAVTHWQDKFAAATLQREEVEAKLAEAREVMIAVRARFQPLRLTPNTKAVMDRVNAFLSPKEPS